MIKERWNIGDRVVARYSDKQIKIGSISSLWTDISIDFDDKTRRCYKFGDPRILGLGVEKRRVSAIPDSKINSFLFSGEPVFPAINDKDFYIEEIRKESERKEQEKKNRILPATDIEKWENLPKEKELLVYLLMYLVRFSIDKETLKKQMLFHSTSYTNNDIIHELDNEFLWSIFEKFVEYGWVQELSENYFSCEGENRERIHYLYDMCKSYKDTDKAFAKNFEPCTTKNGLPYWGD